jgi:hypothetical protein
LLDSSGFTDVGLLGDCWVVGGIRACYSGALAGFCGREDKLASAASAHLQNEQS